LQDEDYVSLGLKVPAPTPSEDPAAHVTVEFFLVGCHELGVKTIYITGSPTDPTNRGCRIWYSLIAPGGKRQLGAAGIGIDPMPPPSRLNLTHNSKRDYISPKKFNRKGEEGA
jgi:hypothetical protein